MSSPQPPPDPGSLPPEAGVISSPVPSAEAGGLLMKACPYCRESVQARADRCRYCHSYLSEPGRQRAVREWLASVGLPNIEVGRAGCLGLSLPGVAIFAVAAYFGAQGLFSVLARQPAFLQIVLGTVGVLVALAFFRVSR